MGAQLRVRSAVTGMCNRANGQRLKLGKSPREVYRRGRSRLAQKLLAPRRS